MGRYDAKTSVKGQTTIPIEVRRALGLEPGGTVQFVTDETGGVKVVAKVSTLRHLKGLFGPLSETLDIDRAITEEVARRNDVRGRDAE